MIFRLLGQTSKVVRGQSKVQELQRRRMFCFSKRTKLTELQMVKSNISLILKEKGDESQELVEAMQSLERSIDDCLEEHKTREGCELYEFKLSIVSSIFGKDSKKYINELRNLAFLYQKSGQYLKALESLEIMKKEIKHTAASESKWADIMLLYKQGICLYQLHRFTQSQICFEDGLQLLRQNSDFSYHKYFMDGVLHTELGLTQITIGQKDKGVSNIEKASEIFREKKEIISTNDEESAARPFVKLSMMVSDRKRALELLNEGYSFLKAKQMRLEKLILLREIIATYQKLNEIQQANKIFDRMISNVPVSSKAKIILEKIQMNQEHENFQLCFEESSKLKETYRKLKKNKH